MIFSMQWISKEAPIYVWRNDTWLNEKTKEIYRPNLLEKCWQSDVDKVFFTKKTKVMNGL